jgi:gluconolactonase
MMRRRDFLLACGAAVATAGCNQPATRGPGVVERLDPALDALIDPAVQTEVLGEGYGWSEGPAWDRDRMCLYFTDVPGNTAYRWAPDDGVGVFLDPSGIPREQAGGFREPGANGLWYAGNGHLLVCNHGRRAVERLDVASGRRTVVADRFAGEPFNSPNDLVQARDGTIYFTDPPYGLEGLDASPLKRQDANGVYRIAPDGGVMRLAADMTFPNGIALSPDEHSLYVAQSDPAAQQIRRFELDGAGGVRDAGVWFDASRFAGEGQPGLPDGMAVSADGHVFATGPGGVLVLSPGGQCLGRILTGRATANCAFGGDGSDLFITAHDRLLRLPTRVRGVQWN